MCTYYHDLDNVVNVAEVIDQKPYVCDILWKGGTFSLAQKTYIFPERCLLLRLMASTSIGYQIYQVGSWSGGPFFQESETNLRNISGLGRKS